jgi:thiamine-monophosphate kinase
LTVVTTDSLIEDVHFNRTWTAARDIGHKALAVNLSDLAAMAATPSAATLSLGLPGSLPLCDFDDLIAGFLELASEARVTLVGGNISASPGPLVLDVTLIGSAHPRKLLTRAGARPGDELYLTGSIGGAAAGLAWLAGGRERASADETLLDALQRYERPSPRLRTGGIVGRCAGAAAAIDLSDGLGEAAWQLAEASGVGLELDADTLPLHPAVRDWAVRAGLDPVQAALAGGEDYELLFAVPTRRRGRFSGAVRRCRDVPVTRIGVVTARPEVGIRRETGLTPLPRGYRHFEA